MKEIKKLLTQLEEALNNEIAKREEYYDTRSEKWQESEKGDEYLEKTDELQDMLFMVNDWMEI